MQAVRPPNRNMVPIRRRNQAQRGLRGQRTLPFPIEIHLPTELTVSPGILARHVIHLLRRTSLDRLLLPRLHQRHQPLPLPRIRRRKQQGLPAGGRQRVTERSKHQKEKNNHNAEKRRRHEVQEPILPRVTLRRRQIQMPHFTPIHRKSAPHLTEQTTRKEK